MISDNVKRNIKQIADTNNQQNGRRDNYAYNQQDVFPNLFQYIPLLWGQVIIICIISYTLNNNKALLY